MPDSALAARIGLPIRRAVPLTLAALLCGSLLLAGVAARGADPLGRRSGDRPKIGPKCSFPKPRDRGRQDRLDATVLFAAARAHEQRQDYEAALQLYERAVQASPGTPAILRHIVVLAFNLDRRAEAARYAQLLVSPSPTTRVLLRRLGLELADEDDLQAAVALYQRVAEIAAGRQTGQAVGQQRALVDGAGPALLT